ncbi:acyl-CoA thioesterase [Actinocatenispora rupis]|uniref:Thioesterase n=1 Tax=Actinocatenispora rupis TaxID=519421 RepID=A0A8J3J496_9ACTN|nr:thioesterase family protein [Actinocatenispora rupis]GID11341.1 thioesterase [Actinocatenispora rupis]
MARFEYDCPIRWSDLDAYRHVNNARFLTLYEEARAAVMFLAARREGITTLEAGTVIVRHEVDYLRQVDFGDPVRIELWIADIRNASFRVSYELFDDGRLASRATSVLAPYDLDGGHPRRLSTAEREFLNRWRDDA